MTEPRVIALLQTTYGAPHPMSLRAFWVGACSPKSWIRQKCHLSFSQIAISYNAANAWIAGVFNSQDQGKPITHIVCMHHDLVPDDGWLDILMDDMLTHNADLLSVVCPIKDIDPGISSTAIDSEKDPFRVERRLTMKEIYKLPPVFDNRDCGFAHRPLLVNTGLFICDVTKAWKHKICFHQQDRIIHDGSRWIAHHAPSDWNLSRDVASFGGKVMATRNVRVLHYGEMPYTNENTYGECWEYDHALLPVGTPPIEYTPDLDKVHQPRVCSW